MRVGSGFVCREIWPWQSLKPQSLGLEGAAPRRHRLCNRAHGASSTPCPCTSSRRKSICRIRLLEESDRRWRSLRASTQDSTDEFVQDRGPDRCPASGAARPTPNGSRMGMQLYVSPSKDLVISLSPAARRRDWRQHDSAIPQNIYDSLLRCSYPADRFNDYFSNTGLARRHHRDGQKALGIPTATSSSSAISRSCSIRSKPRTRKSGWLRRC